MSTWSNSAIQQPVLSIFFLWPLSMKTDEDNKKYVNFCARNDNFFPEHALHLVSRNELRIGLRCIPSPTSVTKCLVTHLVNFTSLWEKSTENKARKLSSKFCSTKRQKQKPKNQPWKKKSKQTQTQRLKTVNFIKTEHESNYVNF